MDTPDGQDPIRVIHTIQTAALEATVPRRTELIRVVMAVLGEKEVIPTATAVLVAMEEGEDQEERQGLGQALAMAGAVATVTVQEAVAQAEMVAKVTTERVGMAEMAVILRPAQVEMAATAERAAVTAGMGETTGEMMQTGIPIQQARVAMAEMAVLATTTSPAATVVTAAVAQPKAGVTVAQAEALQEEAISLEVRAATAATEPLRPPVVQAETVGLAELETVSETAATAVPEETGEMATPRLATPRLATPVVMVETAGHPVATVVLAEPVVMAHPQGDRLRARAEMVEAAVREMVAEGMGAQVELAVSMYKEDREDKEETEAFPMGSVDMVEMAGSVIQPDPTVGTAHPLLHHCKLVSVVLVARVGVGVWLGRGAARF